LQVNLTFRPGGLACGAAYGADDRVAADVHRFDGINL
jgi:hypothetical protein